MAAKVKTHRLESEIEKCRCDANWAKVLDLARQVSTKSPHFELLAAFVQGESKLERYLLESPATDKNVALAQTELVSVETHLKDVLSSDPNLEMKQETLLLLGKLHFAMGDYSQTLTRYDTANLENVSLSNVSMRRLKIIGEAFAIKGLCLEKMPLSSSSKFKQAEREEQIIQCFEKSGNISLMQLQERQLKGAKTSTAVALQSGGQWNLLDSDTTGVGPLVETAIQRSPILYIRSNELNQGISRFRELLQVVETRAIQGLRQILARQLAEVLLRGVCEKTYRKLHQVNGRESPGSNSIKPKKYSGPNLFVPQDENEETLLLLLISESIASREAVLNRSPEHTEARQHTFHNTTAVYDLLAIALVRRSQFAMLSETFERAMKFSFDEFHVWYQFALSLICAEKYTRALLVLKECLRLEPRNAVALLQASKLCFESLGLVDEGIEFARRAADLGEANPLASKAHLALGLGFSLKADEAKLQVTRQEHQRESLNYFVRALSLDSNDHLAEFHVALQLAQLRQIPEALKHVRKALRLRSDHVHSLHLLVLLLSAQKQYQDALDLMDAALDEHPDHFSLLFTKCKLEELVYGVEAALQTCRQMLQLWKDLFEPSLENEQRGTGLIDRVTNDHRSLIQLQLSELSDRDSGRGQLHSPRLHVDTLIPPNLGITGSIRAESIAASRLEQTLSEVASSLGSCLQPKQGPNQYWSLQTQIWLHLAELYQSIDRLDSAQACIVEAGNIYPYSHMVSFMRGCMLEHKGELREAKVCYENALSINPTHVKSLQHLGVVNHKLGNNRMAEKLLRDAVNAEPTSCVSWHQLGEVLDDLGDSQSAAECLMTAVDLETTGPIIPFSSIPRPLH